jgi:tRNA dimethylallyltransferase
VRKPKVLVIVGPTASGKSDLAVELALRFNGEVISADSRQIYKGLDIGSGKITKKEMCGIPHHLLDVADPKKRFNVSEYKTLGEKALKQIVENKKLPIIVGGTGFYIDAITGRANLPEVPPNKNLREKLEKKTVGELFKILEKKDPQRAKNIDTKNKVRLIRALEIVDALGKVPKRKPAPSPYSFIFIGLQPDKNTLEQKIYHRLLERLPGMIREAKKLHKDGITYKRMEELGLEYRYLARFLQNKITKEKMVKELFKEIKHYSKRQYTWFKRNKKISWFQPGDEAVYAFVHESIQ